MFWPFIDWTSKKPPVKKQEVLPIHKPEKEILVIGKAREQLFDHNNEPVLNEKGQVVYKDKFTLATGIAISDYNSSGERYAILAASGGGKSYLAGVLAERMLSANRIICYFDPEGEAFTLSEKYPIIIIGGEHSDKEFDVQYLQSEEDKKLKTDLANQAFSYKEKMTYAKTLPKEERPFEEMAVNEEHNNAVKKIREDYENKLKAFKDFVTDTVLTMLDKGISLIWDFSGYSSPSDLDFVSHIIMETIFFLEITKKRKIVLFIDEAQTFAPQQKNDACQTLDSCMKIAKRGRKHGIDSVWITQRIASLSKDILTQCNIFLFGKIEAEQDFKKIEPYLNEAGISFQNLKTLDVKDKTKTKGHFYIYSNSKTTLIRVNERVCTHGGGTPDFNLNAPVAKSKAEVLKGK